MLDNGFNLCCNVSEKIEYNIIHKPKPMELIPELRTSIERMLWYVPGIDSVQSYSNYLVDDKIYSTSVFDMILETLKMSREYDYEVIQGKYIPEKYIDFFSSEICIKCQKIILTTYKSETELRAVLRHIRNSIAHGSFTIVDKLVIFIDKDRCGNTTAIIKINVVSFDEAIYQIEQYEGITQEKVLARVFFNLGFEVVLNYKYANREIDLLVKRNGITYGIEIKDNRRDKLVGYLDPLIRTIINYKETLKDVDIIPVLIYDKARITDKARDRLATEGIIVLDRSYVSELLNLNDVLTLSLIDSKYKK